MKLSIFFTVLTCLAIVATSSAARAQSGTLPEAEVNATTLGGQMLLVRMKEFVVISGAENQAVRGELGEARRQEFYRAIILDKDPAGIATELKTSPSGSAGRILAQYRAIRDRLAGSTPR